MFDLEIEMKKIEAQYTEDCASAMKRRNERVSVAQEKAKEFNNLKLEITNLVEDWLKTNKKDLLRMQTDLLDNANILTLNFFNYEACLESHGIRNVRIRFYDKYLSFNDYIKFNIITCEYKTRLDVNYYDNGFKDETEPRLVHQQIKLLLDNIIIKDMIDTIINKNLNGTENFSNLTFLMRYFDKPKRITAIENISNPGHWAWDCQYYVFTVDSKYVFHFELYNRGAYTNTPENYLSIFRRITREPDGCYSYESPSVMQINPESIGLRISGDNNIVGGKIKVDALIKEYCPKEIILKDSQILALIDGIFPLVKRCKSLNTTNKLLDILNEYKNKTLYLYDESTSEGYRRSVNGDDLSPRKIASYILYDTSYSYARYYRMEDIITSTIYLIFQKEE